MENSFAKVDLHLHSKASRRPGGWFTKLLDCPESYSEPIEIYRRLKERGLKFVTITDHDTIEGVLEIAHLPEVFLSAEYTVAFPKEALVHVLVYGIDEGTHQDLLKLKENVFEFVSYLQSKGIPHSLAHPLYPVQGGKITMNLVEKFVLLFDNWEIINGTRGERLKALEEKLAKAYDGWEKISQLENKHGIATLRSRPQIRFTAGTDDHGGMDVGKTWTEAKAEKIEEFLLAIRTGETSVATQELGYERLLNTVGIVAYQFLWQKNKIPIQAKPLFDYLFSNGDGFFSEIYVRNILGLNGNKNLILKEVLNRLPRLTFSRLRKDFSPSTLGETILALLLHSLPMIILFLQRKDEYQAKELVRENLGLGPEKEFRLAYITDTYFDINGVARSTQTVRAVSEKYGLPLDVVTVHGGNPNGTSRLKVLRPLLESPTPFYQEFKLRLPSLIELADLLQNYSRVHVATPGPFGLLSFLVAKVLRLPVTTAFHTDIPAYVYNYTKNYDLMEAFSRALVTFHNLSDRVYVPSQSYARLLEERGVKGEKLKIFKRGVDTKFFNPAKREPNYFQRRFKLPVKGRVILYVGRVSKEKNLDTFLACAKFFSEETFVIVGDGPYRAKVEEIKPKNVFTLGYLTGEDLAKAYASSDIFLFPSETETYGFVALEAMASKLPVIVSSKGATREHVEDGGSGLLACSPEEFIQKLALLLASEELRKSLAERSLAYANSLDLEETYLTYLKDLLKEKEDLKLVFSLPYFERPSTIYL